MATKYKIWVEIERIDNAGTDDECPVGIAYRDTLEDAVELQNAIDKFFGEIF
jgi:hypothetical protein